MTQSVLGNITLGFQPLWGRQREMVGLQLTVDRASHATLVDAPHLVRTLKETWAETAPALQLALRSPALLADVLDRAPADAPPIEVPALWLADDDALVRRVVAAADRGLRLIWQGDTAAPSEDLAPCFRRCLLALSPGQAVLALRSIRAARASGDTPRLDFASPVRPDQIYEHVASRELAGHCLDQQGAFALLGWPSEDVLQIWHHKSLPPAKRRLDRVIQAIDEDRSLEAIEQILAQAPLVVYRFLSYVNSAAVGVRGRIESVRSGIMMLGYQAVRRWLLEYAQTASNDPDIIPVTESMVLRARVMEHVLDAGVEDSLRREVYLCGLFSQLDWLLGEPIGALLNRLPLSPRIYEAIVLGQGPYAATLQLAMAMEQRDGAQVLALCAQNELGVEDVNRALLRTLASIQTPHERS